MRFLDLLKVWLGAFLVAAGICGCTDSDEYYYVDDKPHDIAVKAFITRTFDSTSVNVRQDTIRPGDSLVFLTEIYPSKSIRIQRYYWTLDGDQFASEYNFKRPIDEPGIHEVAFIFVDYFGDTLTDTLHVYVASPPELDDTNYIPRSGTQNVSPTSTINFAWSAKDPDSLWELRHHFVLMESSSFSEEQKVLVDTLLDNAYFSYRKGFAPLGKYQWSVSSVNELQQASVQTIQGSFFTQGSLGECAIYGNLRLSSNETFSTFHLTLLDSSGNVLMDKEDFPLNQANTSFSVKPLAEGKYTLLTSLDKYPDFSTDTLDFTLVQNQVRVLDTIVLRDTLPPTILTLEGGDTLSLTDTLKVLVFDEGGKIMQNFTRVKLETSVQLNSFLSKDTLFIPLDGLENSWTFRLLTIAVYDMSGNKAGKALYIRPSKTLPEVFGE